MTDRERFESYTESLVCGISPELEKVRIEAVEEQVPVIRDGTRQLLFFLIRVHKKSSCRNHRHLPCGKHRISRHI